MKVKSMQPSSPISIGWPATITHFVPPCGRRRPIRVLSKTDLLDVLASDYLRTARAKGLAPLHVLVGHALRNAWIPIVTQLGIELGTLLSGAIITETVFSWPGIGRLAVQAVYDRDVPVVEAVVLLAATIFTFVNVLVDLLYASLDPRVRYE